MLEIFKYQFMQNALYAIIAMSIFSPFLGSFLILRRQSLLSDTLGHISLAGIAIGILSGFSTTFSTIIVVTVTAIFLEYLRTIYKNFLELATAILMSAGLAIAMIVMSKTSSSSISLENYLFGSIVTINTEQLVHLFIIGLIIVLFMTIFFRQLYIMTFNEEIAFSEGLNVRLLSISFNIITGIAISFMIPTVGALLVSTVIILPASIALIISKNFKSVIIIGSLISFLGMFLGLIISYFTEKPTSATITLIFISIFVLTTIITKLKK
ncbi:MULTISPECIES: metal ABC transporter permease [unclassified Gemella]|uniref:metal ABC transporter permease n=1 Tax=unclassified Gemella TaxID=2624949 RepID=UPI0010743745|nr:MULTISPECIES: metal ABC transporter permease [unclassified Gemella]MBF0710222.1 metal ABC transporter permease [Gemella sp. GL1.1]MBF0746522.1 metal ABC transporter permease [Gemella sp. 19428wG2_WT2a]NYS27566.1 metal ABC transporter permease [Gemella sp. GL1]TFU60300.1 metal ABC transporter permease [Gemella sp. WT2a]